MINAQSQKEKNGLVTKCGEAYSKTLGTNSLFRLSKKYPTKPKKLISHFLAKMPKAVKSGKSALLHWVAKDDKMVVENP